MSFTRAADELNLTQSAVSKQVAHLETALQHKLFRRVRRSSERDLQPRCGGWLD
jgi:DNA-binding transcriptional LysR family regulator